MRNHDINVKADLNAENPNAPDPGEPVDCDGAVFQNPSPDPLVDATINGASTTTSSWWTGPWPVLHVRTEQSLSTGSYCFEISVDILGSFSFVRFDIWVSELDELNDEGKTAAAQAASDGEDNQRFRHR